MPSTFTTNLGIEKIGTGEQSGTWGTTTNENFDIIDQAVNGVETVVLASAGTSGAPNTLPITDGAVSSGRNAFIEFSDSGDLGATAFVQLTPNDAEKIVHVRNSLSGSRSLTLFQGTYNASNDYVLAAGADVLLKFSGAGASATVTQVMENPSFDGNLTVGGNVGLGIAAPTRKLSIQDSAGTLAQFTSTGTSGGGISLADANSTSENNQRIRAEGNDLTFTTGGTEQMRIDSSGNITVSGTVDGRDIAADGSKLDGIASGAQAGTVTSVATSNGTGISVTGGPITTSGTLTITNTAPDTGTPAILSDGATPSLNSGITGAEVRSLIGAISSSDNITGSAGSAGAVTHNFNRTDAAAYPVFWGVSSSPSAAYSCAAVTIQSSTGTLNATNFTAGLGTLSSNGTSTYGPWYMSGSKGSYGGYRCAYSGVNVGMYDSAGNGGAYRQSGGVWHFYWNQTNSCLAIAGSATASAYSLYVTGAIYATGNVVAYSDRRVKENIVQIDSALDKVNKLEGVYYNKIDNETKEIGFIAQDVQEVAPELVTYAEDVDQYGVKYGNVTALLVEAIKEQQAQIDMLKAELQKALENK